MRAWLLEGLGGLNRLTLGTVDDPEPGPGEVVLRVKYAALNPADRYLAEGQYPARPAFPHILGRDGLGTVVCEGQGVDGFRCGETLGILRSEIGVTRAGTLAEYVAVPTESLVRVTEGWSEEQMAGAPLVYLTAYQALTQWGELPPSSVVLVTGASGGVGVAGVQLAKAMGHTVVAMSRSQAKGKTLRQLGADEVVNPEDTQWRKRVKEYLAGRRVDLAIENIGGSLFSELLDTLGEHGKVSVVGRLAGPVPQFNTASLFFRRLRIGGVAVGTYTPAESEDAWRKVLDLLARTNARPVVDRVYEFEELMHAFERLSIGPMGKVLVRAADGE